MQNSSEVISALREIAALLEFAKAPKFRSNAYERAARVVATVGDLAPLIEQNKLGDLEGIGTTLTRQIEELWNTGRSEFLIRLRSELPEGAGELVQLEGMTPRRLRALHDALGVRSVDELRTACIEERVRSVPGFGAKTEARLRLACDHWLNRTSEEEPQVLLARGLERAAVMAKKLAESGAPAYLAGALRRGEETVRSVEFVVLEDTRQALGRLATLPQVLRVERDRPVAYLSEGLRLELHSGDSSNLGNALVLATGSAAHLEALRARAQTRRVRLAGFGEATAAVDVPARAFATEAELYEALGLAFVPPELRTGSGELAQAEAMGFGDLVASSDIKGMVHCHTTYSDGKNTVLEMARAAHELGMQYLTITDHSPSAHYAGGVSLERLKEQWDEIAEAAELVPIRILRGTESDILADGSLDYPDAVLERFDVVIASIHARHHLDRASMTARLVRALSLPIFKIWGHALGRILNQRDPIDCDVPAILDALAGSRGAIELNADPHRLDLPPAWIPAAHERGIPFVISVDAHSTRGLGVLGYGVTMARRGALRRTQVLNTLSAEAFAAAVRPA